ncbi:hypothetical protein L1987_79859 [Smallanthus sonchifolius]|uniref:Uncharacterized protein n=1 Tax=Smallanthus sonchifolius TaxID=185202 RepID=A0ACB8YM45_9ASTR|nr:hypothetical protein L1987_79859 [Smallanthus sonchifolius]
MEDMKELKTLITIWFTAISSICYCYLIPSRISPGIQRLLSLLPIITLFFILPLPISTVHLSFPTFFFLVWLANFKLLLFAFNRGPLSSKPPLTIFIALALLPINPKQTNKPKQILLQLKAVILAAILGVYHYTNNLHRTVILGLYFLHMYLSFELSLAFTAFLVKIFLGFDFEIEPQFNEPYLATSLQDFWGRRWNLVSSSILRPTVYNPVRDMWTPTLGGQMVAIFVTFVVSGIMHELMFFYVIRVMPTWEVTWFFVLQGVCTAVEVAVKKAVKGRFRLRRVVSGLLTIGFLLVTGAWLFFAQLLRNGVDVKIIKESSILLKLFMSN